MVKKILHIIWQSWQFEDCTWHKCLKTLQPFQKLIVWLFLITKNPSNSLLLGEPYFPIRCLEAKPILCYSLQHFDRNNQISLHHRKYGGTNNISVQLGVVLRKQCKHRRMWFVILPNFLQFLFLMICRAYALITPRGENRLCGPPRAYRLTYIRLGLF